MTGLETPGSSWWTDWNYKIQPTGVWKTSKCKTTNLKWV